MSIATELSTLAANKAAIKAAIEAKTPATAPTDDMSQWPTSIASISGGGALPYDEIVDYITIPAGAYFNIPTAPTAIPSFVGVEVRLPTNINDTTNRFLCGNWSTTHYSDVSTQFFSNANNSVGGMNASGVTNFTSSSVTGAFVSLMIDRKYIRCAGLSSALSSQSSNDWAPSGFGIGACMINGTEAEPGTVSSFDLRNFRLFGAGAAFACIAVRKGSAGALYDMISGTLYENAGSGTIGYTPLSS